MTFVERDELDTYMNANLNHLLGKDHFQQEPANCCLDDGEQEIYSLSFDKDDSLMEAQNATLPETLFE